MFSSCNVKINTLILVKTSFEVEEGVTKYIASKKALMSAREVARDVKYSFPFDSGWRPPLKIRKLHASEINYIRKKLRFQLEGEDIPQPVEKFEDLRLPTVILKKLIEIKIKAPFKIQIQGLPIALSGRDFVGISNTGSGKTLTFIIPMIMVAYHEKIQSSFYPSDGPVGLVLCPSRELARQNYEQAILFCMEFTFKRLARLQCTLFIGGVRTNEMSKNIQRRDISAMIATPGRLKDHLQKKNISFDHYLFALMKLIE
jgi:ATP-dependent RNA helicase DDX41